MNFGFFMGTIQESKNVFAIKVIKKEKEDTD